MAKSNDRDKDRTGGKATTPSAPSSPSRNTGSNTGGMRAPPSAPEWREVRNPNVVASGNSRADDIPRSIYESSDNDYQAPVNTASPVKPEPGLHPSVPVDTGKPAVKRPSRVSGLKLQVTGKPTNQLERSRIGSASVRSADRADGTPVRGRPSPPEKTTSSKKLTARSSRDVRSETGSAKLNDPKYKGYDATVGRPDKREFKCKPRPKDNKPKGKGGSGKKFVPWC